MKKLVYRLRYAWRLHTRGGLGLFEAIRYPLPSYMFPIGEPDYPIDDADAEIDLWREG